MRNRFPASFLFESVNEPAEAGMLGKKLNDLRGWIEDRTQEAPYGCLMIRHGLIVAEWYGGDFSAGSLFETGSIRKSFNSALIGIGIKQRKIDLKAKAIDFWPELIRISAEETDSTITLHQLASGISGWLTPDPPGKIFRYNNAAFTAAEKVVARAYGLVNDEIASEVIRRFKIPLGAESWNVYHFQREFTPEDIENPGPKLAIDSNMRDLVKWGALWLNKGVWNGEELIPGEYIELATHNVNPEIPNAFYGYNWFVNTKKSLWPEAPKDSYGHAGWGTFKPSGGESRAYLWICPSLDIVAAMVTEVSVGFANDFLEIPLKITAEWIGRIVSSVIRK